MVGTAQADQTFSKRPRIIRTPHGKDRPYFSMSRAAAQDRQLSWEARGVLSYLLSKPDDWDLKIADLRQKCGRTKVYHILDELMEHGYLERTAERDKKGVIKDWCYLIHEVPLSKNLKVDSDPLSKKPEVDNSHLPESPLSGLPEVDNADAYIKERNQQSTENTSLQPPAGASVADAPEVAAKAVAPEAKRESGEAVKDKPAKKLKEPRVADPVFKWVCDYLGINADVAVQNNKHEAWGMKGYIVAEEKGRLKQSTPLSAEQLAAIAPHLPGFVPWYETQCKGCSLPTHKRFQVWIGKWYLAGRPNGKPTPATKRAADPNCPHCHGEGVVTTENEDGYRYSSECSCVKVVRNG